MDTNGALFRHLHESFTQITKLILALAAILAIPVSAQNGESTLLGKVYVETQDNQTNGGCIIKPIGNVKRRILTDSIQVEVTFADSQPTIYTLFNHPILKGNSYGRTLTINELDPQGKSVVAISTYWAEINVLPTQNTIQFEYIHLTRKPIGKVIDWPVDGEMISCETTETLE